MGIKHIKVEVCNAEAHSRVRNKVLDIFIKLFYPALILVCDKALLQSRGGGIVEHHSLKLDFAAVKSEQLIEKHHVVAVAMSAVPKRNFHLFSRLCSRNAAHESKALFNVLISRLLFFAAVNHNKTVIRKADYIHHSAC